MKFYSCNESLYLVVEENPRIYRLVNYPLIPDQLPVGLSRTGVESKIFDTDYLSPLELVALGLPHDFKV